MPHTGLLLFILLLRLLTRHVSLLLQDDSKSSVLVGHQERPVLERGQGFHRQASELHTMSRLNRLLGGISAKAPRHQGGEGPVVPIEGVVLRQIFLPGDFGEALIIEWGGLNHV